MAKLYRILRRNRDGLKGSHGKDVPTTPIPPKQMDFITGIERSISENSLSSFRHYMENEWYFRSDKRQPVIDILSTMHRIIESEALEHEKWLDALKHLEYYIIERLEADELRNTDVCPSNILACALTKQVSAKTVQKLLDWGAKADSIDCFGASNLLSQNISPLDFVIGEANDGNPKTDERIGMLLTYGANINNQDKNGNTLIVRAMLADNCPLVELLLQYEPDPNVSILLCGRTPLLIAVQKCQTSWIKKLLMNGAHVNHIDNQGENALTTAIQNRDAETVKVLIEFGADFNSFVRSRVTALSTAVAIFPPVVKLLLESGAELKGGYNYDPLSLIFLPDPLSVALDRNDKETILTLLQFGAKVDDAVDSNGNTLLLQAVRQRYIEIAKIFIGHGADINHVNEEGESALLIAVIHQNFDMVNLLLKSGADICYSTKIWYPFFSGKRKDHSSRTKIDTRDHRIIESLVSFGADINQAYYDGTAVLILAVLNEDDIMVKLLLDLGAKADCVDSSGSTPLIHSAMKGKIESAKLLINFGADVNRTNNDGRTALSIIMETYESDDKQGVDFIDLLLEYGAYPNTMDPCLKKNNP
jgi:uncharacterized protein